MYKTQNHVCVIKTTIIHKIFYTNCSFHMKQRTTEKV